MGFRWFRGRFKKKLKFEWSDQGEITERFYFKSDFGGRDFNLSSKHSETTDSQHSNNIKSENAETNKTEIKSLEVKNRYKDGTVPTITKTQNASKERLQGNTREEHKKNFSTVLKSQETNLGNQTQSVSPPISQETLSSQTSSSNTRIEGTQNKIVKADSKKEFNVENVTQSMQVKIDQDSKDYKKGQLMVQHSPKQGMQNKNIFYLNESSKNAGVIKEEKQESKTLNTAEINDEIKIIIPQGRQESNVATAISGLDYEECDI